MSIRTDRFVTVVARELKTLSRTKAVMVLAIGFITLIMGLAWLSGITGYVPLVLTLLTPLELLIPVLVTAFAYRAILSDREHGELSILQMYPVSNVTYITGVYVGRFSVLLVVVAIATLLAGLLVPLTGTESSVLATHTGLDSPILYIRFVVLVGVFTAVVTSIIMALSTMAKTTRQGLALALALVVVLVIGLDLAIIAGLASGLLSDQSFWWMLAISPASAFRGLVMSLVVEPVAITETATAPPIVNGVSLLLWFTGTLLLSIRGLWSSS